MIKKRRSKFLLTAFFIFTSNLQAENNKSQVRSPYSQPRLIVFVVIDQFPSHYLQKFEPEFKFGLKTLLAKAAYFPVAQFKYVPTETAPGHASLITGTFPKDHGIIGNEWFDRNSQREVLSVEDEKWNRSPLKLKMPTLGDLLKETNPNSKVISVSFKDRSAILLGGKKADVVFWFSAIQREFVTSRYYPDNANFFMQLNQTVLDVIPWKNKIELIKPSSRGDQILWQAIKNSVDYFELGKDNNTDLLAISFSATDRIGHDFGPESEEIHQQILFLDALLGELLQFFNDKLGDNYTLVLTSDHGVLPLEKVKRFSKNELKRNLTEKLRLSFPETNFQVKTIMPDIYLESSNTSIQEKAISKSIEFLKSVPEIKNVFNPKDSNSLQEYTNFFKNSYFPGRSGDLIIQFQENILCTDTKRGTNHGSPYSYDTDVPLFFFGKRIRHKHFQDKIGIEDIVPTLMALLGQDKKVWMTGSERIDVFSK